MCAYTRVIMTKTDDNNVIHEALTAIAPHARTRTEQLIEAVVLTRIPERKWYRYMQLGRVTGRADLFTIEDVSGIPARRLAGFAVIGGGPDGNGGKRPEAQEKAMPTRSTLIHAVPAGVIARLKKAA